MIGKLPVSIRVREVIRECASNVVLLLDYTGAEILVGVEDDEVFRFLQIAEDVSLREG